MKSPFSSIAHIPGQTGLNPAAESMAWILLAAVALILRVVMVVERSATGTLRGMVDSTIYLQIARGLGEQGWIPSEGFFMSPLYPYLLAFTGSTADSGVPLALLLQAVGGVIALLALAWIARALGGSIAGLATLLLGTFAAPISIYDASFLSDAPAFATFCIALAVLFLRPDRQRLILLAGICAALSYGFRANFLPAILGVAAWMFYENRRRSPGRIAVFLLPLAIMMLLLAMANLKSEGHFTPRSFNAGQNLYIGNNPAAEGTYTTLNEIHPGDMMGRAAAQQALGGKPDALQIEGFWKSQAWTWMRDNPGSFARLLGRKFILFLHPYELPQMEALSLTRQESTALSLSWVGLALLLPLAAAGAASMSRQQHRRFAPLWIAGLMALLICIAFFVNGRLRLPIWITLLPLAGLGVRQIILFDRRSILAALVAGALVFLVAWYPVHAPYRHALSASRYAVLEAMAGHRQAALDWMRIEAEYESAPSSIGTRPDLKATLAGHPQARWLLAMERGAAWFMVDDLLKAYAEIRPAADALPRNMRAQQALVEICGRMLQQRLGNPAEIQAARQRALGRLQPRR